MYYYFPQALKKENRQFVLKILFLHFEIYMESIQVHDKSFVPYLKHDEIQRIIKDLAEKVYEDYKDETPIFIGVLNGVIMFFSDFLKYYPGKCEIAFLQVSSYSGTQSTGIVYKKMELTKEVVDRHIILMEDIVDTGNTLENLFEYFKNTQRPKSLKVASLLLKPDVLSKRFHRRLCGKRNSEQVCFGLRFGLRRIGTKFAGSLPIGRRQNQPLT